MNYRTKRNLKRKSKIVSGDYWSYQLHMQNAFSETAGVSNCPIKMHFLGQLVMSLIPGNRFLGWLMFCPASRNQLLEMDARNA